MTSTFRETVDLLKRDPFVFFMFLCLLLLGGDRIAITAGGLTLRLVFPLLMAAFFFLYLSRQGQILFDKTGSFLFLLLAVVGGISTAHSLAPFKSVGYTIWVLFDFFVIISLCYNFSRLYRPETALNLWLWVFRIHALLAFLELAAGIAAHTLQRPRLWFYETSYLAIFMTGYFGATLYLFLREGRRYGPDLILATTVMLALSSATAIAGMMFCVLLNLIVARQRIKLLLVTAAIGGLFFAVLFVFFQDTLYFRLVAGFLLTPNASFDLILARGGNRYIRLLLGLDAFRRNPWLGVGIGGDTAYIATAPYPEKVWALVNPQSGLEGGEPFTNIVVEILGTMGIIGLIPFLSILLYAAYRAVQTATNKGSFSAPGMAFFMGFFSSFLALQFDGTFLRYYLWAPLGLGLGIAARMRGGADTDEQLVRPSALLLRVEKE